MKCKNITAWTHVWEQMLWHSAGSYAGFLSSSLRGEHGLMAFAGAIHDN